MFGTRPCLPAAARAAVSEGFVTFRKVIRNDSEPFRNDFGTTRKLSDESEFFLFAGSFWEARVGFSLAMTRRESEKDDVTGVVRVADRLLRRQSRLA
jgi:hypothetical protein